MSEKEKIYKVAIVLEESTIVCIKAESKESALKQADELADEHGGSSYPSKYNTDCAHRDYWLEEMDNE